MLTRSQIQKVLSASRHVKIRSCDFILINKNMLSDFSWFFEMNYIILYSVSYFFYSQSQSVCQIIKSYCVKNERYFNKSLTLDIFDYFWLIFWSVFWLIHWHFDYFWSACKLWWITLIETESESQWMKLTDTQLCTVRMIWLI